jgi:flagellar operon protein
MSSLAVNPALLDPSAATLAPQRTEAAAQPLSPSSKPVTAGPSFADVLGQSQAPTFSKHALERLQRRGISLDSQTVSRLSDGIQKAAAKGARNSVVLVDGTAFVTSVQNNTVITAVPPEHMRSQVFTNIDSAVIA